MSRRLSKSICGRCNRVLESGRSGESRIGNDCGSFDFPYFDYIIAPATQTHIDRNSVYVSPALDDYNKLHNRKLVFDSIEKMNLQFAPCCYNKYFVTFKVKDMDDGAALKTFQCSFMTFINGPTIEQFREKPTQP
ncbi:hypothetical protein SASPL_128957 [Salvia splendens]|uniref:Uncharacterized protein n=1 Tax=Salvia splendens TaxID=180675 RepID=A0A8X8XDM6_SALSN|nr:hypothetical protein SASPL_128957 [Salvia splendens]